MKRGTQQLIQAETMDRVFKAMVALHRIHLGSDRVFEAPPNTSGYGTFKHVVVLLFVVGGRLVVCDISVV